MIYKFNGIVRSDMIDVDTNLSIIGVFRLVENGVTEMMAKLKIDGVTVKKLYNAMWVFTKNAIKIVKPLPWGESFTVESFITAFSPVRLNIETAIKNSEGEIAAYSKSELCALDLQTGRIRKTSTVGLDESFVREPSLMQIDFSRLDEGDSEKIEAVTVRSTDLDFSFHVNNVQYVKFVLNTYSAEELQARPVKQIEMCYVNQSFENDELHIYKRAGDDRDIITVKKGDSAVIRCGIVR